MLNFTGDHSTSTSLISRIKMEDREAWWQLTELYGPLVYHWCRRMGLGSEDSADLFQEVFSTVAKRISRFSPTQRDGTFRGWLWTITRNKVLDHYRYHRRRTQATGGTEAYQKFAELADPFTDDSTDSVDQSEAHSLYHRALEMIKTDFEERTWTAFWLLTVEQRSTADVADTLHMSPAAVRQAKSRVLRRLRQILGDQE